MIEYEHEKPPKVLRFFPSTTAEPQTLTAAQVAAYNSEGYLSPFDLFTPREAAANRAFFDRLMAKAGSMGWDRYSLVNFELHCATIWDLATHPRVLDLVEDLLGPQVVCFGTHLFSKEPGDPKRVAWHQDAPYYHLSPSKSLTVWLAIDDVDEENSAMRVIPGSHLAGEVRLLPSAVEEESVLGMTAENAESYGPPVSINLRAGQASIHSDMLLHGSEPNHSRRRRCGLAMRYLPVDVRALTQYNRLSIHCRAGDPTGYWAHNARPAGDRVPVPPEDGNFFSIRDYVPLAAD